MASSPGTLLSTKKSTSASDGQTSGKRTASALSHRYARLLRSGAGIANTRDSRQPCRTTRRPPRRTRTGAPTERSRDAAAPAFAVKRVAGTRQTPTRTGFAIPLHRTSAAVTAETELHAVSTRMPAGAISERLDQTLSAYSRLSDMSIRSNPVPMAASRTTARTTSARA